MAHSSHGVAFDWAPAVAAGETHKTSPTGGQDLAGSDLRLGWVVRQAARRKGANPGTLLECKTAKDNRWQRGNRQHKAVHNGNSKAACGDPGQLEAQQCPIMSCCTGDKNGLPATPGALAPDLKEEGLSKFRCHEYKRSCPHQVSLLWGFLRFGFGYPATEQCKNPHLILSRLDLLPGERGSYVTWKRER